MSCFEDNFGEISEVLFEEWLAEQEAEEANGSQDNFNTTM